MGTTICDICNGAVSEDDLRGELKVGTGKHDGRGEEVRCLHRVRARPYQVLSKNW